MLLSLSKSFRDVEAQTDMFRKRCEILLEEEQATTSLAHDIEENLQFYNHLEPIGRRLNAPRAGNSVGSEAFSAMLARLDDCIQYMNTHVSRYIRFKLIWMANPVRCHMLKLKHIDLIIVFS